MNAKGAKAHWIVGTEPGAEATVLWDSGSHLQIGFVFRISFAFRNDISGWCYVVWLRFEIGFVRHFFLSGRGLATGSEIREERGHTGQIISFLEQKIAKVTKLRRKPATRSDAGLAIAAQGRSPNT